jgi:TPR repeat protein
VTAGAAVTNAAGAAEHPGRRTAAAAAVRGAAMGSPGDRARFEELTAQLGGARQLLSDGRPAEAAEVLQRLAPVLPEAAVAYVACLRHGIGIPEGPQPVAAWHILEPLADAEYTPAMLAAALWLRNTYFLDGVLDDSIAKDDARSVRLLERMLDLEPRNRVALCALGVARHNGKGCVEDAHAGLQLCLAAAELGEPEAVCWVGKWMLSHRRAIQDRAARQVARGELEVLLRGKHLVHIAADAGVAYAHHVLADLYRDKDTLPSLLPKGAARGSQKLAEIADWHDMRGAELGAPIGYLNIGEGFSSGAGARGADFDAACMWYETAVSLGVRSGADALGFHYEKGSDGNAVDRIDLNAAVAWYHRGYELRCVRGLPLAASCLSLCSAPL